MAKHEESFLLKHLNERKAWDGRPFVLPDYGPQAFEAMRMAAQCVKEVDTSDPFAPARAMLHMRGGLDLPSDVLKECSHLRGLRRMENARKKGAPTIPELEPLKKKLDADWAWNQHKAAQYVK